MAGCVPCFIIPLLLFIFHRYIQPIVLKYWNPWENKQIKGDAAKEKNKTLDTQSEAKLDNVEKKEQ